MANRARVYRYKSVWSRPDFLPAWGTREAIAMLDGCVPIASTERDVPAADLDPDGFLRFGREPDSHDPHA